MSSTRRRLADGSARDPRIVEARGYATHRDDVNEHASRELQTRREGAANWLTMAKLVGQAFEQSNAGSVAYDMAAEHSAAAAAHGAEVVREDSAPS